ncbi:MAG: helix-turn-helix domain-containing protein [Dehalobacterium sp.]
MLENVGKRIQELRKEKNMTITALANEANTSRSLISQIESGYTYPSLQTLEKIVKALGITLSNFFKTDDSEIDENDFVVRADKRQMLYLPDTQNAYYLLSKTVYQNIEFLFTDYPPNSNEDSYQFFVHEGLEFFWVVEGQIHLTVDGKTSILNKGDSGCFNSRLKHRYVNQGDTNAQIVLFSIKE